MNQPRVTDTLVWVLALNLTMNIAAVALGGFCGSSFWSLGQELIARQNSVDFNALSRELAMAMNWVVPASVVLISLAVVGLRSTSLFRPWTSVSIVLLGEASCALVFLAILLFGVFLEDMNVLRSEVWWL